MKKRGQKCNDSSYEPSAAVSDIVSPVLVASRSLGGRLSDTKREAELSDTIRAGRVSLLIHAASRQGLTFNRKMAALCAQQNIDGISDIRLAAELLRRAKRAGVVI